MTADLANPTSFAVHSSPVYLAVEDLDGDGALDLVVPNSGSNDVSILRGDVTRPGSFHAATNLPVGNYPAHVAIGDLDGDGQPDVAVGNLGLVGGSTSVSLLFQQTGSPGTFLAARSLTAGDNPEGVALGDLDGDGRLDLVAANHISGTLSVFRQDPVVRGAFLAPTTYPAGPNPILPVLLDLDGDGHAELAVTNAHTSVVTLFAPDLGHPGRFFVADRLAASSFPRFVTSGDLDGDGRADLVVSNQNAGTLSLLRQDGAHPGSFLGATSLTTDAGPSGVACTDLDGDGRVDLVVANLYGGTVEVFLQDPANPGTFLAPTRLSAGPHPHDVAVADLDGDGRPDLVVAASTTGEVRVFIQDATNPGAFLAGVGSSAGGETQFLALADLNGDGKLDLANGLTSGEGVSVLLADAAHPGKFLAPTILATGSVVMSVAFVDLDGDGRLDLLAACRDVARVSWWPGAGDGTFGARRDVPAGSGPWCVRAADLTGDGRPDLVVANREEGTVQILLQDSPGTFVPGPLYRAGANPSWVLLADLDGDGRLDLSVSNGGSADASVLRGR